MNLKTSADGGVIEGKARPLGAAGRSARIGGAIRRAQWSRPSLGLLWAGLLVFAGCSVLPTATPDATRYYVLSSPTPKSDAATAMLAEPSVRLVVRAIAVPEFLRGKIMPVRVAGNELNFVDEARWAEPLEHALSRIVRDGVTQRQGVRVVARSGDAHDYEVLIQVRDFEGVLPAGVARLTAHVEIFSTELDPKLVAQDDFSTDIAGWDGKNYGELARKLSEAADALAGRIASLVPAQNK